jgi:hypothetical protein
MTFVINRYYDPTTDQFLSIDPEVASTDQPYVFTNDDPLNAEDPLGLCFVICSIVHAVASVADHVGNFVAQQTITVVGFGLDTTSLVLDGIAIVDPDDPFAPAFAAGGVFTGALGAGLSAAECSKANPIACIGAGFGTITTGLGTADLIIDNEVISASLAGAGLTFGGAALSTDTAGIIIKVVKSAAKTVVKTVTKKK